MTEEERKKFMAAMDKMAKVVESQPYHRKLNSAWRDLKQAAAPVLLVRREKQRDLF